MPLSTDLANRLGGLPFQCIWQELASDDTLHSCILQWFWGLAEAVGVLRTSLDVQLCGLL